MADFEEVHGVSGSPMWHLLQLSDVLDLELASALAESLPVTLWEPHRRSFPFLSRVPEPTHKSPNLQICAFPIMRGYARFPLSRLLHTGTSIAHRLQSATLDPASSPLICTIPYFAEIAAHWRGPVVYWLTDRMIDYKGARRDVVLRLDRKMVASADLVCPNSQRLAEYLIDHAHCEPDKVHILPNAGRSANLLPSPNIAPGPRPETIRHLAGPLAGVIGNLAGNMDWVLLRTLIELTPHFTWLFVGPSTMAIADPEQQRARKAVLQHPRSHSTGHQPYRELVHYARALDVAVLPYRRCEPTYSGSSTRFYEHLAACHPILATTGVYELLSKSPLLQLVRNASEAAQAMEKLRLAGFEDGLRELRWQASRAETWEARAQSLREALASRLGEPPPHRVGIAQEAPRPQTSRV